MRSSGLLRITIISAVVIVAFPAAGADLNRQSSEAERLRDTGYSHYFKEQYQNSIAVYSQSIKASPRPDVFLARAAAYQKLGDYGQAIADCDRAIECASKAAPAYFLRGYCHAKALDVNRAIADYTTAIELDPSRATAFVGRASLWMDLDQYDLAITDFDSAAALDENNLGIYYARSMCWRALRELSNAIADAEKAIAINPQSHEGYLARGNAKMDLGQLEGSRDDFERAVALNPESPAAIEAMASFLATCPEKEFRNYLRAIELANSLCELKNWVDWEYLELLALIHAEAGNLHKAIEWQDEALKSAPQKYKRSLRDKLELLQAMNPGLLQK